jgi:Divergent InlB B-repeat domain
MDVPKALGLVVVALLALPAAAEGASLTVIVPDSGVGRVTTDVGGIDCTGTCSATVPDGATVTLTASPAPGYALGFPDPQGAPVDTSGWAGCSPLPSDPLRCTVQVPSEGSEVEASFRPAALLLVVANGGGGEVTATVEDPQVGETAEQTCFSEIGGGSVCPFPYLPGRVVTLTAPAFDHPFPIWSDDDCLSATACTLVLDELRRSITATFATQQVFVHLNGPGRVFSTPAGIDVTAVPDDDFPVEQDAEFPTGQEVTLTAEGDSAQWATAIEPQRAGCDSVTGALCRVTAERSRWTVVSFAGVPPDEQYPPVVGARLRVRKSGSGSGSVSGGGIDCGSTCSVEKKFGDRVVLVADASSGSRFDHWRSGCGTRERCPLTVGPTTRVTAVFGTAATATAAGLNTEQNPAVLNGGKKAEKLRAVLARMRVRRVGGRYRIVLPLRLNLASTVTARVRTRRGRSLGRWRWELPAGDRRLVIRMRAPRGRYRLSLTVGSQDRQVLRMQRKLRLR